MRPLQVRHLMYNVQHILQVPHEAEEGHHSGEAEAMHLLAIQHPHSVEVEEVLTRAHPAEVDSTEALLPVPDWQKDHHTGPACLVLVPTLALSASTLI